MTAISHVNAGNRLSASKLNTIIDQVNALTAPGWTDFSASLALTAVTTNPTKGNSVYVAQYRYVTGADVCDFEFEITIGSGFAAGSGTYRINLPVACAGGTTLIGYMGGNESGVALRGGS